MGAKEQEQKRIEIDHVCTYAVKKSNEIHKQYILIKLEVEITMYKYTHDKLNDM